MKKGFTLIELLVVIAIIAILAAILFPVFAQAREKARGASCLSNCKQIGTAITLYLDDYDETYPPKFMTATRPVNLRGDVIKYNVTDWTSSKWCEYHFFDAIYPYVKNVSMFVCPSQKYYFGYGVNSFLCGFKGWSDSTDPDVMSRQIPTISQIKSTSTTVAVVDALIVKNNCSVLNAAPYLIAPEPKKYDANISADAVSGCRHNGGSNFTFADGHAKFYKFGQGPTEKNANHKGDAWGWKDPWWDFSCQ